MVSIDNFQVCLESLLNFHGKNQATFHLIFVAKIQQHFASNTSQHVKRYSHQAFDMRIQQRGYPIFTTKIQQSFTFGAVWCIGKVSHLCMLLVSTCSYYDVPKPSKVSSVLMRVAYMGKPMSLGDMDQDNHIAMIVHTIQHKYAPTAIALSAYPLYKVKSSNNQKWSLMQP